MIKKLLTNAGCLSFLLMGSLAAALPAGAQELSPELNKRVLTSPQGSIVELPGILTEKLPCSVTGRSCNRALNTSFQMILNTSVYPKRSLYAKR